MVTSACMSCTAACERSLKRLGAWVGIESPPQDPGSDEKRPRDDHSMVSDTRVSTCGFSLQALGQEAPHVSIVYRLRHPVRRSTERGLIFAPIAGLRCAHRLESAYVQTTDD